MKYSLTKKQKKTAYRIVIAIGLVAALLIAGIVWEQVKGPSAWEQVKDQVAWLYLVPYIIVGYDILKKAWKGIIHGQVFDENFLMALATLGAIGLGDLLEAVAVMLFYQIGELFQSMAVDKSRKSISELMDIMPDYANVMVDGRLEQVDPDDVEVGTEIIVNPGEKIPMDGIVTEGESLVDTSALTGESVPRTVSQGSQVLSGCINLRGVLKVETTKEFEESTAAKILDLVENSAMRKAKTENFITKFARYYTPVVCIGAVALALGVPAIRVALGMEGLWITWITRALTFLVISCPCALVISIPLSFFAGIGCASSRGVLVKGSNYLESLSKVKYVLMDKTGTLTEGKFQVVKIVAREGYTKEQVLEAAAYGEAWSHHPMGHCIKEAFEAGGQGNAKQAGDGQGQRNEANALDITQVTDGKEISGKGVVAQWRGQEIACGNKKLMDDIGVAVSEDDYWGSTVYVALDKEWIGTVFMGDVVKENSKAAVANLKSGLVKKVVMLSGDAQEIVSQVGSQLGLDESFGELLPDDKVRITEGYLKSKGAKEMVAFVGDGINDAPVLAISDVGMAMGALGQDAAIEAADVVLMDDDPLKIPLAIRIAKKTLRIVKENIGFALTVKGLCLILGALGIANMWMAIFADVGVMVIAVINAMRALKV